MNPTREELLQMARLRDANRFSGVSDVAWNFVINICEFHNPERCDHAHDAYSLALDGEDVNELL